jgi:hypothetical protein
MVNPRNPAGGSGDVGGDLPQYKSPNGQGYRPTGPRPQPIVVPPVKAPPGAPAAGGTSTVTPDQSAIALIVNTLNAYGLGNLANWAWQEHLAGKSDDQILLIDAPQTQEYKQRFPGMAALSQTGQAITPGQYVAKEQQDAELIRAAGLDPTKYASREALGNLIGAGVSSTELQSRLNLVQSAVAQAPVEARQYLQDNFGITNGDLADYFLDPNGALPALQMKAQAAAIGGAAAQTGFGYLDVAKALQLAGQGITQSQAQAGFGKIATEGELTRNLGDGTGSLSSNDLIDAQLGGNGLAANKLAQVAGGRVAQFQGGGTYAASQRGVSGLGVGDQGFG